MDRNQIPTWISCWIEVNWSQLDLFYLLGAFGGLNISDILMVMGMLGIYAVSEFLRSDLVASSHETKTVSRTLIWSLESIEEIRNYETLGDQLNWEPWT